MFPDFVEISMVYSISTIFMDICTVLAVQGGQTIYVEYGPFLTPNLAILQHTVCLKMVALVLGRIGIRIRTRLSPTS